MHLRSGIAWVLPAFFACTGSPAPSASPSASAPAAGAPSASAAPAVDAAPPPKKLRVDASALPEGPSCKNDLRCRLERAYAGDEKARAAALALFDETGDIAGQAEEETMDGGFRGTLHLLPQLPVGGDRVQLERVLAAARDFDRFFHDVGLTTSYRWRELTFRFFRSMSGPAGPSARSAGPGKEVQRTTPSAYADGFTLAYNVKGSLLTTETGVRETIFHEVFHMNDAAHGDWSRAALSADYAAILKKCGAMNVACLKPYAPNDTMVRGGTYYAFEPNNGLTVREYAAELALRWYKEHRALLRHEPFPLGRFKCGPPENRRAWDAMVKEFFAIDLVPPCP